MLPEEKIDIGCSTALTLLIEIVIAVIVSPVIFPATTIFMILFGVPHILAYTLGVFACLAVGWVILYMVGNPI